MPCSQATEKMVSPSSPVIIRPSISRVLTLMPLPPRRPAPMECKMSRRAAPLAYVRFVLLREVFQGAEHGVGRGLPEAAQAGLAQ